MTQNCQSFVLGVCLNKLILSVSLLREKPLCLIDVLTATMRADGVSPDLFAGFAHDNSRRSGNKDCLGQAGAIRMVLQPSSLILCKILWRRRNGCIISIPCSSEYGMGVTSSNFSSNHSDMGSPPDRFDCHQFELKTGDICLSNPRPESLGSGCNDHLLERDIIF
jgi:hypothetical protein